MKTSRVALLTAAVAACGVWFAISAAGTTKQDSTCTDSTIACDTTRCRIRSCHVGAKQVCPGHTGAKCEKAGSAACKDLHAKGACTGHTPEGCVK